MPSLNFHTSPLVVNIAPHSCHKDANHQEDDKHQETSHSHSWKKELGSSWDVGVYVVEGEQMWSFEITSIGCTDKQEAWQFVYRVVVWWVRTGRRCPGF